MGHGGHGGHGHAHGHAHGSGLSKPSKATKAYVATGLRGALGDRAREMQAIAPLQLESPMLFMQCSQLVEAGNGGQALQLIETSPTRMSGGMLAFIIVAPIVFSGVLVAVILALTLGR